jgi:hypothetical protein
MYLIFSSIYILNKSKNEPFWISFLMKIETASLYFLILALLEYLELEDTLFKCSW